VLRLGLVGSPNSGKTTLFNALTGLRAKVGNYPGVTVERREGRTVIDERDVVVIDLPGTYSLNAISPDEEIVNRVIDGDVSEAPNALVMVADACSLERSLMVVAQVLRKPVPSCLVLTMIDELQARGGVLDMAYRHANRLGLAAKRDFEIPNAAFNRIAISAEGWKILDWGERAHLERAIDDLPD